MLDSEKKLSKLEHKVDKSKIKFEKKSKNFEKKIDKIPKKYRVKNFDELRANNAISTQNFKKNKKTGNTLKKVSKNTYSSVKSQVFSADNQEINKNISSSSAKKVFSEVGSKSVKLSGKTAKFGLRTTSKVLRFGGRSTVNLVKLSLGKFSKTPHKYQVKKIEGVTVKNAISATKLIKQKKVKTTIKQGGSNSIDFVDKKFFQKSDSNADATISDSSADDVVSSARSFVFERTKKKLNHEKNKINKLNNKMQKFEKKTQKSGLKHKKSIDKYEKYKSKRTKTQQKAKINKIYKQRSREEKVARTASHAVARIKTSAINFSKGFLKFVTNSKNILLFAGMFAVPLLFILFFSSCSLIFTGGSSTVYASYPSEEADMIAVNDSYTVVEDSIQNQIDNIEDDYEDYDEYNYNLDNIAHDPHELTAYLSALFGVYTSDDNDIEDELDNILQHQYTLTIDEVIEIKTRTEIEEIELLDEDGNVMLDEDGEIITESVEVEVEYEYKIVNVTLVNHGVYSVANDLLNNEQLDVYNTYRETFGGNPMLFGGGVYNGNPSTDISGVVFVNGERLGNQDIVDIALSQVGNVGGQPYWSWYGFDYRVEWCACFVSWTLNQAGYSEPKFAGCTSQGRPYFVNSGRWAERGYEDITAGDVIFFDWDNNGDPNHVGIVIGTDGSRVYTVEGNSSDACCVRDYPLDSNYILGYGLMN